MDKFLLIYRSESLENTDSTEGPNPEIMKMWGDWIGGGFAAGWMVDGGDALADGGKVVQRDKSVTDGPFAETKELVGGFSIVQAESFDAAAEYAKTCPVIAGGGTVEVRRMAGFAGPPE